jgi:hypothetical protein
MQVMPFDNTLTTILRSLDILTNQVYLRVESSDTLVVARTVAAVDYIRGVIESIDLRRQKYHAQAIIPFLMRLLQI